MGRFLRLAQKLAPRRLVRCVLARLGALAAALSILSIAALAYVFGAYTMATDLPPAQSLRRAFAGGHAWSERQQALNQPPPWAHNKPRLQTTISIDKPDRTFDGFTLYTTNEASAAFLLDMRGNVVHRWELAFDPAWRAKTSDLQPFPASKVHWFRCHLYPNGDLLAICHAEGDTPYGYGLVKMDRDSRILWVYAGNAHHDVDVGEDGTIYAITQQLTEKLPDGMEDFPSPCITDTLVILSSDGKELDKIPILEAFRDSPYMLNLSFFETDRWRRPPMTGPVPIQPPGMPPVPHLAPSGPPPVGMPPIAPPAGAIPGAGKGDILHANSVRVLNPALATKSAVFKPGQVLVSLHACSALAVVDRKTRSVAWSSRGVWRGQHDAELLENGNLLLYDNHGSSKGTRILEYDPRTQAIPWCYDGDDGDRFRAPARGMKQRLPNGNTLIVDPDAGRLFEVTPDKHRVWECLLPIHPGASITGASRHAADKLTFLKGDVHARP